jgi:hypothetical protein
MTSDVTQDRKALTLAIGELLEDQFAFSRVRRIFESADGDDRDHALASLPDRTLSPGFYRWAEYLIWLEERIKVAPIPTWATLSGCEMDGLVLLKNERRAWESRHPACPCGSRMESRFVPACPECGLEFRKRSS